MFFGKKSNVERITMAETERVLASGENVALVDVRESEEYATGAIPGAVNLPLQELMMGSTAGLPAKDKKIFVYCHSGRRSRSAAALLSKMGYEDVVDIGGIYMWKGEIETPKLS